MAYRTVVIAQFTVSKQINTCPGDSGIIQCTYPLINSQRVHCVWVWTQSSDTVTKMLLNLHLIRHYIFRFHHSSNTEVSVRNASHCEGDWASLTIHYLPLWNITYILRLNVAAWIPDAPPLIHSCWNLTASRRMKTWLMAKGKSHPVATCPFKSMRCGFAMLQRGWQGETFWRIW